MHISEVLKQASPAFSFEFFPPKTPQAAAELFEHAKQLALLEPSYVSVTYGAGGSTRELTRALVGRLRQELNLNAVPHLTCVGSTREELRGIIQWYKDHQISNILALRGDPPGGAREFVPVADGLSHADDLVRLIRECGDFGIGVAGYPEGHPETTNKLHDLDNLKRKVDAGAHAIITQIFFDNRDFYDFRERCQLIGIRVPIIAGIMPVLSRKGIERMAGMCGARLPAPLLRKLLRAGDHDEEVRRVGVEWATEQARDLISHGVRGIHFYTLNRSTATMEIYRNLGVSTSGELRQLAPA
jgi:methylenetetrahydrofolate reductase (NADPH)